jgi:hypothetical protein
LHLVCDTVLLSTPISVAASFPLFATACHRQAISPPHILHMQVSEHHPTPELLLELPDPTSRHQSRCSSKSHLHRVPSSVSYHANPPSFFLCIGVLLMQPSLCRTKPSTSSTLLFIAAAAPLIATSEHRPFPSPCLAATSWSTSHCRAGAP